MAEVGIIGGGPGGLAAAYHLAKAGHHVTLFEAAPELGGLARSFELGGACIERYYHFICAPDTAYFDLLTELELGDRLRWRTTGMGFFHSGQLYSFSSPVHLLRIGAMSLRARLRYGLAVAWIAGVKDWQRLDGLRAVPWLRRLMGEEAYRVVFDPLLRIKFLDSHERISAAWIWHRIQRVASSRKTLFHRERLGYLSGGTQTLVDTLVEELERHQVDLRVSSPVDKILVDGEAATGVRTMDGGEVAFDHVVSAVPLPVYRRLGRDLPPAYLETLDDIDFIAVVCLTFRLRRALTPNFWTNVNDPRIPFNGVIEYTNLNPGITPDGSRIVYVPYYVSREHSTFLQDDEGPVEETFRCLQMLEPTLSRDDVLGTAVSRDPFAQVICPAGFLERVPEHRTPLVNLFLLESSQLYPSDRTISGTLALASDVAGLIGKAEPA